MITDSATNLGTVRILTPSAGHKRYSSLQVAASVLMRGLLDRSRLPISSTAWWPPRRQDWTPSQTREVKPSHLHRARIWIKTLLENLVLLSVSS